MVGWVEGDMGGVGVVRWWYWGDVVRRMVDRKPMLG